MNIDLYAMLHVCSYALDGACINRQPEPSDIPWYTHQLMAVREEMWAQAARDRDALESELGLRFLDEANERASEIVEEVNVWLMVRRGSLWAVALAMAG